MKETLEEIRMAEEIVSVLPTGVVRAVCDDPDAIRYSVCAEDMKLKTIVLRRTSLRRLIADPARLVKLDYLQRDLLKSARRRAEYRYPRPAPAPSKSGIRRKLTFGLRIASAL